MAAIYVAIGLGLVVPGTARDKGAGDMLAFGLGAASMFLLGAGLLLLTDRRWLWAAGALLQVAVIAMYIGVAPSRTPSFETWGLLLRILQIPLLVILVWLAATPQDSRTDVGRVAPG
jgi:hypothetical protein